jgi:hypothetical protein
MEMLNEAWSWVLTWHWGWQTFAGLLIFSWVAQAWEYCSKTHNADIVIDMKVGAINMVSKVLEGIANLLAILTPFIFLGSILYWLDV